MKNPGYVFLMMLILVIPLSGQVQYTSAYRSGEGRSERATQSVILVNPVFVQPSIFFSSEQIDTRTHRKWWRSTDRILPRPYQPGELPANILRKDEAKIEEIKRKRVVSLLITKPELHTLESRFTMVRTPARLLDESN